MMYCLHVCTYFSISHHRFIVEHNCIPPLCDLLTVMDIKIVQVALNGLENILKLGEQDKSVGSTNQYALIVEQCGGKFNGS